ncbi:hypothetical protein Sru01_18570 [Sphaerisporangium rufum]|uniref:non-specific serine/threonine protein kinase n=1 Tax=Sphaerisporangium rufum TaxID=1381558 RepID=A0A919V439_9ACTN|nr:serine/threonine-protein kinase [Sphaerisporangium rufum]GII76875.1 hypothetical protein Sru01_18570 [Sphaerisporangium rufum]
MSEARPNGRRQGRRVADRYQLLEPIGRGGMGIVWRAHDELLDRPVAVKEVRYPGDPQDDEVAELNQRTLREARAAGRLTHPNVVVVHDVIEEDGRPWIVMQLVDSRSLGQVLRDDGPLPVRMVADIGLQVLEALRSAHAAGVLHRDVKPENVLLTEDGRVVLTDFGIARMETDTTMTRTGLVGTPAFIAPERLRGSAAQRESDLWSLGSTLYAAVEGRPPHDKGMAMATMHAVLTDAPEPPKRAGRLAPVLLGLLEKDPDRRLGADQAERMLRAVAQERSTAAPAASASAEAPAAPPVVSPAEAGAVPRAREGGEALREMGSLRQAPAPRRSPESGRRPAPPRPGSAAPAAGAGAGAAGARPGPGRPDSEPDSGPDSGTDPGAGSGTDPGTGPGTASGPRSGARSGAGQDSGPRADGAGAAPASAEPDGPDGTARPDGGNGRAAGTGERPAATPAPARTGTKKLKAPVQPVRPPGAPPRKTGSAAGAVPAGPAGRRPYTAPAAAAATPGPAETARSAAPAQTARTAAPAETAAAGAPPVAPPDPAGTGHRPLPLLRIALLTIPALLIVGGIALWLGLREAGGGAASGDPAASGGPGGDRSTSAPATSEPASSAPASPTPAASPSKSPKPEKSSAADVPAGWHRYKHHSGFSIALPKKWRFERDIGPRARFRGPDPHAYLEIAQTSSPEKDAKKTWERDVPGMSGNFPGYKLIAIREVKGYWKTAADWEFTFGNGQSHVIDRGFVTDKRHGYAIVWKTAAKDWKKYLDHFQTFTATFKPDK